MILGLVVKADEFDSWNWSCSAAWAQWYWGPQCYLVGLMQVLGIRLRASALSGVCPSTFGLSFQLEEQGLIIMEYL